MNALKSLPNSEDKHKYIQILLAKIYQKGFEMTLTLRIGELQWQLCNSPAWCVLTVTFASERGATPSPETPFTASTWKV